VLAELSEIRTVISALDSTKDTGFKYDTGERAEAIQIIAQLEISVIETAIETESAERLRDRLRDFGAKRSPLTLTELQEYQMKYSEIFQSIADHYPPESRPKALDVTLEKILFILIKKTTTKAFDNLTELTAKNIENLDISFEDYFKFIKTINSSDIFHEDLQYYIQKKKYALAKKIIENSNLNDFISKPDYQPLVLPWLIHFANEIIEDLFQGKKDVFSLQIIENGTKHLQNIFNQFLAKKIDLTTAINFPYNPNPNNALPDETVGIQPDDQATYKNNLQKLNFFPATQQIQTLNELSAFITQYKTDIFTNFLANEGRKFITVFIHCETSEALKKEYSAYKQFRQFWLEFSKQNKIDLTFPKHVDPKEKANAIFSHEEKMPAEGMFLIIEKIHSDRKANFADFALGKFFTDNKARIDLLNKKAELPQDDDTQEPPSLITPPALL
jgi:hypothetical protein